MDIKLIAHAIRNAAGDCTRKAKDLNNLAKTLEETGDLTIVGEAISCYANQANARLDLLAIRPIRALTRELSEKSEL